MTNLIKGEIVCYEQEQIAALVGTLVKRKHVKFYESRYPDEYDRITVPANVFLYATGKAIHGLPVLSYYDQAIIILDELPNI